MERCGAIGLRLVHVSVAVQKRADCGAIHFLRSVGKAQLR